MEGRLKIQVTLEDYTKIQFGSKDYTSISKTKIGAFIHQHIDFWFI